MGHSLVHDADSTTLGHLECVRMGSVLLSFLCHEATIWATTHCLRVERTVLLAELHDFIIRETIAPVRDGCDEILLLVLGIPHLAAISERRRHRIINDDVAWHVQ